MDPTSPIFENLPTRRVIPDRKTLEAGFPISPNCIVRNPTGTGFGGGAIEVEVLEAHPGDHVRLSAGSGIEIEDPNVNFHGRLVGSILQSADVPTRIKICFEARVYYEAASALITAIEFMNNASPPKGTRTIEICVTDSENRTTRAQIVIELPVAFATKRNVVPELPPNHAVQEISTEKTLGKISSGPGRMTQICVLLARMRSGTTAFREVLATNPNIFALGEIFHNNNLHDKDYFYHYFLEEIKRDPALALPSEENRNKLFAEYISYLKSNLRFPAENRCVLILGVNYNSLHSLNSYWQHPFSPPYVFQVLRRLQISIIHMRRANLLRTLVSERRARRSGIWHRGSDSEQQSISVELNLQTLQAELEERYFEIEFMERCLTRYPGVLNLTYEETFGSENVISHDVLMQCAKFLKVDNDFASATRFRPTAPPTLREAISNYDDVARLLSGTRFAVYLDEADAPGVVESASESIQV